METKFMEYHFSNDREWGSCWLKPTKDSVWLGVKYKNGITEVAGVEKTRVKFMNLFIKYRKQYESSNI